MFVALLRRLISRCLIFDADTIGDGLGTGHFIAPFYLREAHVAQAVAVILQGAERPAFLQANADGCSGPQKKVGLKTHAAGTVIQNLGVATVCLIKI